jgi:DNA modification methylase
MPETTVICKMKGYIQPFERRLALMELESLADTAATPEPSLLDEPLSYQLLTSRSQEDLADRLTYWESVGPEGDYGRYTRQVRRESTANVVRNGITPLQLRSLLPFETNSVPVPNRRTLRYGPHGAHEYRGKFFPQLARSLLNTAGVNSGDYVLDPMCGSGTTLIEASLLGCTALGVDMNPLSVLMSRAKSAILQTPPDILASEYESLKAELLQRQNAGQNLAWLTHLPRRDQEYLASWFAPHILTDLDAVAVRVHSINDVTCRDLFRLCLSNILRRVSWQKDDDLRVRKEIRPDADIDVIAEFLAELTRTVRTILAFLYEDQPTGLGAVKVIEGDARFLAGADAPLEHLTGKIKAVVTSPPYATALPYLDTDRLSLCYLGLLPRPEHRTRDYKMIGNREVTENQRQSYWTEYLGRRAELPEEIVSVIDRISALNEASEVGFRRRNLPALLARYFLDMREVLRNIATLLSPGASAYVIIGNNHTMAGGVRVDIETDRLLGMLGQTVGLTLGDSIPMEMLLSRDIFRKNTGTSETIIEFLSP